MRSLLLALSVLTSNIYAQAIYDANGQYKGYSQTTHSGVTTTYNSQGQSIGSSQIDNGQTNYYSPNGAYRGTNTAPAHSPPNPITSINSWLTYFTAMICYKKPK